MIKRFNRFELKYVLRLEHYLQILPFIKLNMKRDEYALSETGKYTINSLYYDSPGLDCFVNKLDGIKFRRKVRIRKYQDSTDNAFVEIKERINRSVRKRRCIMPLSDAFALCHGDTLDLSVLDASDHACANEVFFLAKTLRLNPVCIIHYQREAFTGSKYEPGLRVTFDTNLKYRTHQLNPALFGGEKYFFDPDVMIMEIKTNDKLPIWLSSVVTALECSLNKVSKYVLAMSQEIRLIKNKRIYY
jgi:hypothetical protein